MTGNISCTKRYAGGIYGAFEGRHRINPNVLTRMVNYMSGNITGMFNGGMVGYVFAVYDDIVNEIRSSIVAMNGNTTNASISNTNVSNLYVY